MAAAGFEVIPAIDVSSGRLARLHAGSVVPIASFGGDPGQAAAAFVEAGARWLHVVDLDLAMTGSPANLTVVERLCAFGARVQASGGIATPEAVDAALDAGAERVVLGSGVFAAGWLPAALTGPLADRLVLGLEVEGAAVRPRGRTDAEWPLDEILGRLAGAPPRRALVTAVAHVGGMAGPDLEAIASVARSLDAPVLAAGGIATPEDLRAVAALGIEGAIVGRALYEGVPLEEFLGAGSVQPPGGT